MGFGVLLMFSLMRISGVNAMINFGGPLSFVGKASVIEDIYTDSRQIWLT